MNIQKNQAYPSIAQSFGITGMIILSILAFSPILFIPTYVLDHKFTFFLYYTISMGVPLLIAKKIRVKKAGITFSRSNFDLGNVSWVLIIIFTTIIIQIGIAGPIISTIPMPQLMKDIFFSNPYGSGIYAFLLTVIAAPIIEELIFRGIILNGLLNKYSPTKSILISSVLFGLIHLNPWQFISAVAIGSFSGWIYYKTKSIALSIIVHMTNNLFAFTSIYYLTNDMFLCENIRIQHGIVAYVFFIFGSISLTILGIYLLNKSFKKIASN